MYSFIYRLLPIGETYFLNSIFILLILNKINMNNREKIIYCAGLFDGEGCVSYGEKSGYLQLHLGMKDPESVKFFSETFNLNVTTPFFKKRGYIMYHVGAGNNRAKKILERIIPFLIMKKTKAKHCINKYKTQTRN